MLNNSLMTPNMRPNQPGLAQVLVEMLQVLTSHSAATDGPPEVSKVNSQIFVTIWCNLEQVRAQFSRSE